jgi:hypothetical protein
MVNDILFFVRYSDTSVVSGHKNQKPRREKISATGAAKKFYKKDGSGKLIEY